MFGTNGFELSLSRRSTGDHLAEKLVALKGVLRKRKNRTLRVGQGPERSKFPPSGLGAAAPEVKFSATGFRIVRPPQKGAGRDLQAYFRTRPLVATG